MSILRNATVSTLAFGLIAIAFAGTALAQPPRVSPMATVSQTVGLADVEVTYSRPFVKEREVFGGLEPWGKVWRTGANEATKITFEEDAKVEGKALPAGTYSLFTIPRENGKWTVIFNKEADQWGAFQYKEEEDALRVDVTAQPTHHHEMFTIAFSDVTADSTVMNLVWKETRVPVEISFDTTALAFGKAQADFEAAKGGDQAKAQPVWGWAGYFLTEGEHEAEALEMASWVAGQREIYWTVALEARLLAANGKTEEAVAAAHKAMELGKHAQQENPNPNMASNMEQLEGEVAEWQAD